MRTSNTIKPLGYSLNDVACKLAHNSITYIRILIFVSWSSCNSEILYQILSTHK